MQVLLRLLLVSFAGASMALFALLLQCALRHFRLRGMPAKPVLDTEPSDVRYEHLRRPVFLSRTF